MSESEFRNDPESVSTMFEEEWSFVADSVGCRSFQPGFSEQGRSCGIRPLFDSQPAFRWHHS